MQQGIKRELVLPAIASENGCTLEPLTGREIVMAAKKQSKQRQNKKQAAKDQAAKAHAAKAKQSDELSDEELAKVAGGGKIKFNEFTIKKTTDSASPG